MQKAKILVVGPCESGKSVISNFLADATETSGGEYHPTQGVRILEFESGNSQLGSRSAAVAEVELWDCSGDQKFDECWPAIMKDTNGVVIVYNPDVNSHERELDMWYSHFVTQQGLRETQCLLMAHLKPSAKSSVVQIPSSMSKVSHVQTNLEEDGEGVRREFDGFLGRLLGSMSLRQDQEELSIIQ